MAIFLYLFLTFFAILGFISFCRLIIRFINYRNSIR